MRTRFTLLTALALLGGGKAMVASAEEHGLVEDSTLNVLSRNFFLHNDYRTGHRDQSYRQEWAQGFIANFQSGFTQGQIGVGLDAHAFYGLKLDGGRGHAGTGLLPLDSDGRAENDYSSAGAAIKLRYSKTTLKFGEMEVETPVFDTADKRLQPEYATGFFLDSQEIDGMRLVAGHFSAFKNQNASTAQGDFDGYGASTRNASISLAGVELAGDGPLGGSVYASQLSDTWQQYYGNLHFKQGLSANSSLLLDSNLYRTLDAGDANAGSINNTAYSFAAKYSLGSQAFTLAYQKIDGGTPFDFVGGDSIYLANSIKYADFNSAHEQSWQLRYDLDFSALGVPGLKFMTRYVTGDQIDGTHAAGGGAYNPFQSDIDRYQPIQGNGGRHWERDIDLKYTVQSGAAKNLSFDVSHVSHRANTAQAGDDIDRLYLVIEYPLDLLK
ncbi:OprD family porin [Pseudomonas syringae]|uniref:Membrane protein n=1 Tax=Pseudomonas syringae TaxID=317 RepID=A0A085VCG4_PSESX|nr:OprD family porin [Pseudomonas syringae]KFE53127.1 membrane protein [Pseudomonas syringae]